VDFDIVLDAGKVGALLLFDTIRTRGSTEALVTIDFYEFFTLILS
jgi:hypothetical protein